MMWDIQLGPTEEWATTEVSFRWSKIPQEYEKESRPEQWLDGDESTNMEMISTKEMTLRINLMF